MEETKHVESRLKKAVNYAQKVVILKQFTNILLAKILRRLKKKFKLLPKCLLSLQ